MAGIGFELKKLFQKTGVFNTLKGIAYASLTTIGPLILILATMLGIYALFGFFALPYQDRNLLSSSVLYVFIFSLIGTAPFSAVLSRYVADQIFIKQPGNIMASYYVGLMLCCVTGLVMGVPFCLAAVVYGNVDPYYMLLCYGMFIMLCVVFFTMAYINILKEYKRVAVTFFFGMLFTLGFTALFYLILGQSLSFSIMYAFIIGYIFIAVRLYVLLRLFIPHNTHNYRDAFGYFNKFRTLFFANLFYVLGLYIHNFVFWGSSLSMRVAAVFVSAPTYDFASCIAMFTNISFLIIFVVKVETNFYDLYNDYCHVLIAGNKLDIDIAKKNMFASLYENMMEIIKIQLLITVCVTLISYILFPLVGMGGLVQSIYPTLSIAYVVVFINYALIVVLYYFDDGKFAFLSATVFLICTFLGAWGSSQLVPELYGAGLFFGALCGFSVSIFRIANLYKTLDYHIFCKGDIVATIRLSKKSKGVS